MGRLFGTDGVRGVANETLTCERALQIGRAAATVLAGKKKRKTLVLVGMDTRLSSDMLANSISAGLCSVGADVINIGVVPTPAVAYLVQHMGAQAGVMISASHNPSMFNGIKIFNEDGYKLADELEERIESIVLDNTPFPTIAEPDHIGRVTYMPEAKDAYVAHLLSTVKGDLSGLKIAVDCANGSSSVTAQPLFSALQADSTILFDRPDGININDNCGSTHLEALREFVISNNLDCGVAFDGDADRCLMVDDCGELVDGDQIMAIMALDMKNRGELAKNTVVGTIMTNFGFGRFCEKNGINFVATKVGDRYVLEEMLLEGYNFGGEQSGHVIFKQFSTTGDGQLTAIQTLSMLKKSGKKLSELAKVMTRYPQFIFNIPATTETKLQFFTDPDVKEILESAKEQLGNGGRLVVRPSGTEPLIRIMAEGDDNEKTKRIAKETADAIESKLSSL